MAPGSHLPVAHTVLPSPFNDPYFGLPCREQCLLCEHAQVLFGLFDRTDNVSMHRLAGTGCDVYSNSLRKDSRKEVGLYLWIGFADSTRRSVRRCNCRQSVIAAECSSSGLFVRAILFFRLWMDCYKSRKRCFVSLHQKIVLMSTARMIISACYISPDISLLENLRVIVQTFQ